MTSRPRALHPGARVALVAPAGPVEPERIEVSVERCESLGLQSVVFPAAGARHRFLAGTDSQRLADLQAAFDDPSIDGVWALRGGYGTPRIVHRLDLSRQERDPIPFIGFSDNTAIHVLHAALNMVSFHGPHPGADLPPETEDSFRRVLFSAEPAGELPVREGDPSPRTLVDGAVGLAFGRFTGAPDDDPYPVVGVISEFAERIGVPAVTDLPFGHVEHNCTLPVGVRARLDGDAATLSLSEAAVRADRT